MSGDCCLRAASSSGLSCPSSSMSRARNNSGLRPDSFRDSLPSPSRSYRRTRRAANSGPAPSNRRLLAAASDRSRPCTGTAVASMALSAGLNSSSVMHSSSSWSFASSSSGARRMSSSVRTPLWFTSRAAKTKSSVLRPLSSWRKARVAPTTRSRASASLVAGMGSAASLADSGRPVGPRRVVFSGDRSNSARLSWPS